MIAKRILVSVVWAVSIAVRLSAQTTDTKDDLSGQIITVAWGDPTKCNEANAKHVAFLDAAQGIGVVKGECVAITAYWKSRAIFADLIDANTKGALFTGNLSGRRLGIYADDRTLSNAPHRPKPSTIIGLYASCTTEWPGALMVGGYCHYTDGPFLKVSQIRPANQQDVR